MDYIEYDEFGIKEIRCMACKAPVVVRSYIEVNSQIDPSKKEKVLSMKRLGNYAQISVDLSDGTYAEPIVCSECKNAGSFDMDKIMGECKAGWRLEMTSAGRSQPEIDKQMSKVSDLKIEGRIPYGR